MSAIRRAYCNICVILKLFLCKATAPNFSPYIFLPSFSKCKFSGKGTVPKFFQVQILPDLNSREGHAWDPRPFLPMSMAPIFTNIHFVLYLFYSIYLLFQFMHIFLHPFLHSVLLISTFPHFRYLWNIVFLCSLSLAVFHSIVFSSSHITAQLSFLIILVCDALPFPLPSTFLQGQQVL